MLAEFVHLVGSQVFDALTQGREVVEASQFVELRGVVPCDVSPVFLFRHPLGKAQRDVDVGVAEVLGGEPADGLLVPAVGVNGVVAHAASVIVAGHRWFCSPVVRAPHRRSELVLRKSARWSQCPTEIFDVGCELRVRLWAKCALPSRLAKIRRPSTVREPRPGALQYVSGLTSGRFHPFVVGRDFQQLAQLLHGLPAVLVQHFVQ